MERSGAATHPGERRPLLRGLCKIIPPNTHGGPGRGAGDTFKLPPRKAAEKIFQPDSAARGQRREGMDGWMDEGMDAPGSSRAPRMRRWRSGSQGSALVPPSSRAGPAPAACRLLRTSPRTLRLLLFVAKTKSLHAAWEANGEWEAKPKQAYFKLCPCSQPPELDAGTGGTSHPELPEGPPKLEVGPQPVLQAPFH